MDESLTITGGTLFAWGNQGLTQIDRQAKNNQKYISQYSSYSSGKTF